MGVLKKKDNTNDSQLFDVVADLIIEEYRFYKSFISITNKLYPEERQKHFSAADYHGKRVNELATKAHLSIQDFEGKLFDDGLPVTPLNMDDFTKDDILIIYQTIEPAIINMESGKAIRYGSVILAKKENTID